MPALSVLRVPALVLMPIGTAVARQPFTVNPPFDDIRDRADIMTRTLDELRAEGPHAYKGIHAIIDTLVSANIAKPVAELMPIMTIKS